MDREELLKFLKQQRKIDIKQLPFKHEEESLIYAIGMDPKTIQQSNIYELDLSVLVRLLSYVHFVLLSNIQENMDFKNPCETYIVSLLYSLFGTITNNYKSSETIEVIENILLTLPYGVLYGMLSILSHVMAHIVLSNKIEEHIVQ